MFHLPLGEVTKSEQFKTQGKLKFLLGYQNKTEIIEFFLRTKT